MIAAALIVALSSPTAAAAPAKSKKTATEAPPPADPARAQAEVQASEAAIRAGDYEAALAALNRAAALAPNLDTIYLRRSGVLERRAGPAATWDRLRTASPAPEFRQIAEQLFYAAADAELYVRLANPDPDKRGRIEARIGDLRLRQRRAEELAAPPAAPPPVVGPAPPARPFAPPVAAPPPARPTAPPVTAPAPSTRPSTPPVTTPAPPPAHPAAPPVVTAAPAPEDPPLAVESPWDDPESAAREPDDVSPAPPDEEGPPPAQDKQVEAPEPAPRVAVTPRCEPTRPPGAGLRIGGAVITSLGVGLLGAAFAGVALGRTAETEYEAATDTDARARADARGKAMNTLTIAGFVSSATLIGAGASLLGVDAARRKRLRAGAAVSASHWGLVLQGRF